MDTAAEPSQAMQQPHTVASATRYLLKGADPFDPSMTIEKLFGPDLKGRVLQEAIWSTYQALPQFGFSPKHSLPVVY